MQYFVFRISKENLATILAFVMEHNDRTLMEGCKDVIVEHFEDCLESVLGLPETAFREVLGRDDLNVPGEEVVFRAIIRWYEAHHQESGCPKLAHLLSCLRINQIPQEIIDTEVLQHHLIREDIAAR